MDLNDAKKLVNTHRNNLRISLAKRAKYGDMKDVPTILHNEIIDSRKQINQMRLNYGGAQYIPIEYIDLHEEWYYDNNLL